MEQQNGEFLLGAKAIADFLGWKPRQVYTHKDRLPIGRFGGKMIASREKLKAHLDERIGKVDQNLINSGS